MLQPPSPVRGEFFSYHEQIDAESGNFTSLSCFKTNHYNSHADPQSQTIYSTHKEMKRHPFLPYVEHSIPWAGVITVSYIQHICQVSFEIFRIFIFLGGRVDQRGLFKQLSEIFYKSNCSLAMTWLPWICQLESFFHALYVTHVLASSHGRAWPSREIVHMSLRRALPS